MRTDGRQQDQYAYAACAMLCWMPAQQWLPLSPMADILLMHSPGVEPLAECNHCISCLQRYSTKATAAQPRMYATGGEHCELGYSAHCRAQRDRQTWLPHSIAPRHATASCIPWSSLVTPSGACLLLFGLCVTPPQHRRTEALAGLEQQEEQDVRRRSHRQEALQPRSVSGSNRVAHARSHRWLSAAYSCNHFKLQIMS